MKFCLHFYFLYWYSVMQMTNQQQQEQHVGIVPGVRMGKMEESLHS